VFAALVFLVFGYFSKRAPDPRILRNVLTEGLTIVGWVFLWEAFSVFVFQGQTVRDRQRNYVRFKSATVTYKYI